MFECVRFIIRFYISFAVSLSFCILDSGWRFSSILFFLCNFSDFLLNSFFRSSFFNSNRPSINLFTIHFLNGFSHNLFICKLNISNTNSFQGSFISDNSDTFDFANILESIPEFLIFNFVRQVTNKSSCFIVNFKLFTFSYSNIVFLNDTSIRLASWNCISFIEESDISIHWICTFLILLHNVETFLWDLRLFDRNRSEPNFLHFAILFKEFLNRCMSGRERDIAHKDSGIKILRLILFGFLLDALSFFAFVFEQGFPLPSGESLSSLAIGFTLLFFICQVLLLLFLEITGGNVRLIKDLIPTFGVQDNFRSLERSTENWIYCWILLLLWVPALEELGQQWHSTIKFIIMI